MENNKNVKISRETNDLQRKIRKTLEKKNYKRKFHRTNCYVGDVHLNSTTEYFMKGYLTFEIERDLERKVIKTIMHVYLPYNDEIHKNIKLEDILILA